jgi:transposase
VADTKSGTEFLAFLLVLVARYVGRDIVLVCDNGRFHTTKGVQQWLAEHRDQIDVFWLRPYSPSLDLIERLWGRMKLLEELVRIQEELDATASVTRAACRAMLSGNMRLSLGGPVR